MTYFLGIDIGTTSTKAIVFSSSGAIAGMGNQGYGILVPQPTWAEQDPKAIFAAMIRAICDAVDAAGGSEIAAIGFSTAMHTLIAMDAQNHPLTNSIIWADQRSVTQSKKLKIDEIGNTIYQRTGVPIHPMSPLLKLMWMRETQPDTFRQAAKFVSLKEYVLYQLFERYVVDYSIASATGLFNLEQLNWDELALGIAGITKEQLSELVPTTYILRGMKVEYAQAMKLAPDTPTVIGANDGVLASLGVGAIIPESFAITVGTSGAVRTVSQKPITDPQQRTFCYYLSDNLWVIGGAINSGGIIFRWLRDEFCAPEVEQAKQLGIDPYEVMIKSALKVPAGASGLLCLPFLAGERSPSWNALARGVFFGVGLHHTRAHFIRSVLEGILFAIYSVNIAVQDLTVTAKEIRVSGGFARNHAWLQMMADMFGQEVITPEVYEASGFGAAVLAMYAVGAIADLSDVHPLIRISKRYQPNLQSDIYKELFSVYQRVYHNLVEEFDQIAILQGKAQNSIK